MLYSYTLHAIIPLIFLGLQTMQNEVD